MEKKIYEIYMSQALKEAKSAYEEDEVPVGAVIVYKNKIIAKAHNQVRRLKDPTAHAEILAITQAATYLNYERLSECSIYVTIEPCLMCGGAIVLARIDELIYGADDNRFGAFGSILNIANRKKLNHRIKVTKGIMKEECSKILQEFFQHRRQLKVIPSN